MLLITAGVVGFALVLYASLLSKLLPPSGFAFLDAVRSDWYVTLVSLSNRLRIGFVQLRSVITRFDFVVCEFDGEEP